MVLGAAAEPARFHKTSVLMTDGRVLVSGGRVGNTAPDAGRGAEPVHHALGVDRLDAHAALAAHGHRSSQTAKVLVTGGFTDRHRPGANAQPVTDTAEHHDRPRAAGPRPCHDHPRDLHVTPAPRQRTGVRRGAPDGSNFTFPQ